MRAAPFLVHINENPYSDYLRCDALSDGDTFNFRIQMDHNPFIASFYLTRKQTWELIYWLVRQMF